MFGLEQKNKRPLFEFDLEKELKGDPSKTKEMLAHTEKRIQELKTSLREGAKSDEFDEYGTLLHGYTALQRVLTRIEKKKPS